MFNFGKKPMTKRQRKQKISEFRSAQMKSINERRRAGKEVKTAKDIGKNIALDHATHGLYSKGVFSVHALKSVQHYTESRRQRSEASRLRKELRKDTKIRKK
jgi:hypothetical protein